MVSGGRAAVAVVAVAVAVSALAMSTVAAGVAAAAPAAAATTQEPAGCVSPAPAAPVVGVPVDQIYPALSLMKVPAHYVILVDISGSMQDYYTPVKNSLGQLFAALAPQDKVTLLTFSDIVHEPVFDGELRNDPYRPVSRLPAIANGDYSDIGRAVEAGVSTLEAGGPTIATLVLVTDGAHAPAPGSPYPHEAGYNWNELGRRAAAISGKDLSEFAVPLTNGATGAALLRTVFPKAQTLQTANISELTSRFDQPKQEVLAGKARSLLAPERTKGVSVQWPDQLHTLGAGITRLSLTLRRDQEHIPLTIRDLAITSDNPALVVRCDVTEVLLDSQRTADVPFAVEWRPARSGWPYRVDRLSARLTLTGTVSTAWADALKAPIGVSFEPRLSPTAVAVGARAQTGQPVPWLGWLGGLALLAAAVTVAVWLLLHPKPVGRLVVTEMGTDRGGATPMTRRRHTSVPINAWGIKGTAHVRTGRVRSDGMWPRVPVLDIVYNPEPGKRSRRGGKKVGQNGSAIINSVEFGWDPTPQPRIEQHPDRPYPGRHAGTE